MRLLLQKTTLYNENDNGQIKDILIESGVIKCIGQSLSTNGLNKEEIIDCRAYQVLPGFFDMHVHFREPGGEQSEDIRSGLLAARQGGFTGVAAMANTNPAIDTIEALQKNIAKAKSWGGPDYYQIASVTKSLAGEKINDIAGLRQAGAIAFSDDGKPLAKDILQEVLTMSREMNIPIIEHCEENNIKPENPLSEIKAVERNLNLLAQVGGKLHLAHISCKESMEMLIGAKKANLNVTCEVTPHHLALTKDLLNEIGALAKMNPPLREKKDVAYLQEATYNGWVDAIATDHAPHSNKDKDTPLGRAPYGVIGLETAVGVVWQYLYHNCGVQPSLLGRLLSSNPRQILGLPANDLKLGEKAQLTIVDPEVSWTVTKDYLRSRSANSSFLGRSLRGRSVASIKDGMLLQEFAKG